MAITIYHYPRCRKSRAVLDFLKEKNEYFEIVDYQKQGLSVAELKKISQELNLPVAKMIRTQEIEYKRNLKGCNFSEDEWYSVLSGNLKLLKRPIVKVNYKAAFVETKEDLDELMSKK